MTCSAFVQYARQNVWLVEVRKNSTKGHEAGFLQIAGEKQFNTNLQWYILFH